MVLQELGLIPILPAAAALIVPLISFITRNRFVYSTIQTTVSAVTMFFSIKILEQTYRGEVVAYAFGAWPPPLGITYVADALNSIYGFLACSLATTVSIYSFWYYRVVKDPHWLALLTLLLHSGVTGCIYTGDVFNFFVMLEVLALSSYALVAFFKKRRWAVEAAAGYAFIGALATTFFLFGVAFLYLSFGTLNMADLSIKANPGTLQLINSTNTSFINAVSGECRNFFCFGDVRLASAMALAFMLWALTFEAGLFPNNYWLPASYTEAPTPASTLFAGVVDKVGTYGVLRLFLTIFTPGSILSFTFFKTPFRDFVLWVLAILGLITGFIGALVMAIQKDVKRLLSYSTISHIGLIFMATAGLTHNDPDVVSTVIAAVLFHSLTHAYGESLLFMGLGTLATVAGSRRLDDLSGYGRVYPSISLPITIGALSLLGIAPLGGFFSKYLLFLSLSLANQLPLAIMVIAISGVSAVGYFKIIHTLFFAMPRVIRRDKILIASGVCIITSIALVIMGILFIEGPLFSFFTNIGKSVSTGQISYVKIVEEVARKLGGSN